MTTQTGFNSTAAILCMFAASLTGQSQHADHYTPKELIEQSAPLRARALAGNGAASATLEQYGVDYTMLAFRSQDGAIELHQKFADIFVIVDGTATLRSGGELVGSSTLSPGEFHGTEILHAATIQLAKGDVVHIPANTPHQLLIPAGGTLTYFVIKVKEKE